MKSAMRAAMILAVTALLSVSAQAADKIKIGALYNLTGGLSSLDGPSLNGAKLAAKQVNASGGLLGKEIEVIAYDTKTDQGETAKAASQLPW